MADNHLRQFLANLKAKLDAVDPPNLGPVFISERRWSTEEQLRADGAVVVVDTAGVIDTEAEDFGPVVRFWLLEGQVAASPFTNGSHEYHGQVRIVGFYGHNDERDQAIALRRAAEEILDALGTRTCELEDLALGIGDGYMGYLEQMPRMLGPVRGAQLQSGVKGYAVELLVHYSEEVAR